MLPELGAGAGAYLGSQIGQAFDAPRSISWNLAAGGAKGLADALNYLTGGENFNFGSGEAYGSGAEMLSGALGMDPENALTQGLGIGTEMLLDPTTIFGGAIGRGLGALGSRGLSAMRGARAAQGAERAAEAATVADRLAGMTGALDDQIAGESMRRMAAESAGTLRRPIAPFMQEVDPLRQVVSSDALASGAKRTFPLTDPVLAGQMEGMGLGEAAGNVMEGRPVPFEMQAGLHPNMNHADKFGKPGVPPTFAQTTKGRPKAGAATLKRGTQPMPSDWPGGTEAWASPPQSPMPNLTPDDVALLREQSQPISSMVGRAGGAGPVEFVDDVRNMGSARDPFKALANSRYLDESTALSDQLRAMTEDAMPGLDVGTFSGPFTPQITGAGPDFFDRYGPMIAAGLLGGGVGSAYAMGQNR